MSACKLCGGENTSDSERYRTFLKKMAFKFGGVDFAFPPSSLCASCRHQQRLAFRNEQNLYPRVSCTDGKRVLSTYHEKPLWGAEYKVMPEEEWRGETLNPLSYGREIDFSRPFSEQYAELHKALPRMALVNLQNENSPFTTHTGYSKNCYLLPCSEHCEDCYYGRFLQKCKNCVDTTSAHRSELCYECFQISDCYRCAFVSLSDNCSDCYFSENLVGCKNCLFCTNLRRGEYCIRNNEVSREEFRTEVARILGSAHAIAEAKKEWQKLRDTRVHRPANLRNCEDCEGDFLLDSRNTTDSLDATACEDCTDLITAYKLKDTFSSSNIYLDCELNYEMLGCAQNYHCAFGFYIFRSQDILYSEYIYDSKNLFGCVGLSRAENCILNKQYSPAEFQAKAKALVEHMKQTREWGEPLPPHYSPFGYNETVASDLFPLTRNEALEKGFLWRDLDEKERPKPTRQSPPNSYEECTESLTKEVFQCEETQEPFKLIAQEIAFYRSMQIAPPRISPRARHRARERLRFPTEFRQSSCIACGEKVATNVPRQLSHTLKCEACYQNDFR